MPQDVIEGFRLSPQQRRAWRWLGEGDAAGLAQLALRIAGPLEAGRLREALARTVEEHEILRTGFPRLAGMEVPVQRIFPEAEIDLDPATAEAAGGDLEAVLEAERRRLSAAGWDEPRIGAALMAEGPDRLLVLTVPTLVTDRVGLALLAERLAAAYGNEAGGERIQYADVAEWQNELLTEEGGDGEERRRFWRRLPEPAPLTPWRPVSQDGSTSHRVSVPLPAASDLAALARAWEVDADVPVVAAWYLLLWRLSGDRDLVVGHLSAGRNIDELASVVGPMARYLPVAPPVASDVPLRDFVASVARAVERGERYQEHYPEDRDRAYPALFESSVSGARHPAGEVVFTIERTLWPGEPSPLRLILERPAGGEPVLHLECDTGAHGQAEAHDLARRLEVLLEGMVSEGAASRPVADLPLLSPRERADVLAAGRGSVAPAESLEKRFRAWLAMAEDAPGGGLEGPGLDLDAAALAALTARLAAWLAGRGLGAESRLVILLGRGSEAVVACLAALRAGVAAVPLDASEPTDRLRILLEEARHGASDGLVLVADGEVRELTVPWPVVQWSAAVEEAAETGAEATAPPARVPASALAYLIFTSGSTGRPRGVMVPRSALANLLGWLDAEVYGGADGAERVAVNAPLSFDASVKQWIGVLGGRTAVVVPEEVRVDGSALLDWLADRGIAVLDTTPAQLRLLFDAGLADRAGDLPLRRLLVGGEAVTGDLWRALAALDGVEVWNVYGPTETTVDAAAACVGGAEPVLGAAVSNVRLAVVDRRLHPQPPGLAGELAIAGAGLARGYAGAPGRTAERFVPDPTSGEVGARLYLSGDRVRWPESGALAYVGRIDRQVKLRGHRVEPGEVEAVLCAHPEVREAAVVVRHGSGGETDRGLAAYVVPRSKGSAPSADSGRFELPNGLRVAHRNRNETAYLYEEIFAKGSYTRHGVTLPATDAVVFDVGANIGMFSLFAGQRSPGARIYAFEPLPELVATLAENADLLPAASIRVVPHGLSDAEREETFSYYPRYTMMSGQESYAEPEKEGDVIKRFLENELAGGAEGAEELLAEADELLAGRFEARRVTVKLRRLSSILAEEGIERVDLLKVDVQRAELDVLRGLDEADWPKVRQVVMEAHDEAGTESEGTLEEIRGLLESHGFAVTAEQDELLVGTDRWNVYAVRPDDPVERGDAPEAAATGAPVEEVSAAALASWSRRHLPPIMVPTAWAFLERLPLTRRGKVDLDALPAAEETASEEDVLRPRNAFEEVVAGLYGEVLDLESGRVGVDRSFFDLGGHSLLATRLMSRIRQSFEVELPLRTLFEAPSVAELAERVEAALRQGVGVEIPPIEPRPRGETFAALPLSYAQQRLWFAHQVEPDSAAYNIGTALSLEEEVNVPVLDQVISELVRRHEVLRTTFPPRSGTGEARDEVPYQHVHPAAFRPLPVVDLGSLPEAGRAALTKSLAHEHMVRAFDLAADRPLRLTLLRGGGEGEGDRVLYAVHHIASDAWSTGRLVAEVGELYTAFAAGRPSPLPELAVQYADYALWQRDWLAGEMGRKLAEHWRGRLADAPPSPRLGAGEGAGGLRGGHHGQRLAPDLASRVAELSAREGATLFMTLLAAFAALLSRHTGEEDVVVGTDVANRNHREVEDLIGFFVNNLVLRLDLSGGPTFRHLVSRARETALAAYAHQDYPFDLLVRELRPRRQPHRTPLFQVLFVMQNAPHHDLELPGLRISADDSRLDVSKFDLAVFVHPGDGDLGVDWVYRRGLFEDSKVERLAEQFETVLDRVTRDPDLRLNDLEVVSDMEKTEREAKNLRKLRGLRRGSGDRARGEAPVEAVEPQGASLPLTYQPKVRGLDLAAWARSRKEELDAALLRHGALLFTGFPVRKIEEFEGFAAVLCDDGLYGGYGDLPKEDEGENVYRSTPYPPEETILFHNESSHMDRWPRKQFFHCLEAAEEGGETPIVDCRQVYRRLNADLVAELEERGLVYVRNFVEGYDVPWREFFHTDDRAEVEERCQRSGVECRWKGDVLETRQQAPAVIRHPVSGEKSFFNQIPLHHPAALDPEVRQSMQDLFAEEDLPRTVRFGDGEPIPDSAVEHVLEVYWDCSVARRWLAGDILMVDNMLVAHARNPFAGSRKIAVAMGDILYGRNVA